MQSEFFDLQNFPVITVILPVFNGIDYLKESIESVLSQSLENFNFLIIDDCSEDESWSFLESLQDPRIQLIRNKCNKGLFYNLNFLAARTTTPLIKLWSQDDIMYPDCLRQFVGFFQKHPDVGFAYCGIHNINEKGMVKAKDYTDDTPQLISTAMHARIAFFTGSIAGNIANVCISRKAFEHVGLFNEKMKISADFDMWVRLAKSHDTGFIPAKLVQLRDHEKQLSRNEKFYINHVKEDLEVYRTLENYVSPAGLKEGRKLLRNHKLVFYYTLMVKALLKGHIKEALAFYKSLSGFDNIFILSICFLRAKLFGVPKPLLTEALSK